MEKFRSICIIYKTENNFEAAYLKTFFEFIGLQCFTHSSCEASNCVKASIFDDETNKFDILINLNNTLDELKQIVGKKIADITIDLDINVNEKVMLNDLFFKIQNKVLVECNCIMLKKLIDIYNNNNLCGVFYNRALNILTPDTVEKYLLPIIEVTQKELDDLCSNIDKLEKKDLIENLLYAKFFCLYRKMFFCKNTSLSFESIDKYVNEIDFIYNYDNLIDIDFLKGQVSQLSFSSFPFARFYYERCIKNNKFHVLNSEYYYKLAVWAKNSGLINYSSKLDALSLKCNNSNIHSLFSEAIEGKLNLDYVQLRFLSGKIIKILNKKLELKVLLLDELEYLCKSFVHYYQYEIEEIYYTFLEKYISEQFDLANTQSVFYKLYNQIMPLTEVKKSFMHRNRFDFLIKNNFEKKLVKDI